MSDTSNDPRDPVDVSAFQLPIASELMTYATSGSKDVSAEEARRLIRERFSKDNGYVLDQYSSVFVDRFASLVVEALPAEAMKDAIVNAIDLRPYMEVLATKGGVLPGMDPVAGREDIYQRSLELVRRQLNDEALAIGSQLNTEMGIVGGEAQSNLNQISTVDSTQIGLSPSARYASRIGQVQAGTLPSNQLDDAVFGGTMYDEKLNTPTWNEDDVIAATMLPTTFLDTAIAYEADFNEQAGTPGKVRGSIILETEAAPERVPPNRNDRRRWPAPVGRPRNKTLSYGQAASYLNNLTDAEYTDWQSKLATAGYYDQIGSQYVAGDRDDQATAKAWDELLKDAWTGKKGIDVTLVEKAKTARELKAQRTMARWGTTETSRDAIEAAAMEILGRQLSAEEFGFVRDSIASLQQERADDLVGVDSMNWYNEETAAQGFDASDVNDRIMREFGGELAVQNAMDVRQALRDRFDYQADPVVIPGDDYTVPVTPFEPSMVGSAATPRFPTGRAAVPRFPTGRAAVPRFPTGVAAADGAIEGAS